MIVLLDTRGHIVVPRPVAQIRAKMVEHVRYLDHGSNAIVLLDTMETNVSTHHAQTIPV